MIFVIIINLNVLESEIFIGTLCITRNINELKAIEQEFLALKSPFNWSDKRVKRISDKGLFDRYT
jgi:hypothetical protein